MNTIPAAPRHREITGRMVLFCFIGFFALVAAVNAVMIRFAVTTFAGTETDSAYRAGLAYKGEEAAATSQDALHWKIDGGFARNALGEAVLTVDVKDARNATVSGIEVSARLAHPLNSRLDRKIALARSPDGNFRGATDAEPGQWTLTLEVTRDEARAYRSVSRLVLK
ncbi:MAG: FixH family protein [Pseudorhodoplanes sp.]